MLVIILSSPLLVPYAWKPEVRGQTDGIETDD